MIPSRVAFLVVLPLCIAGCASLQHDARGSAGRPQVAPSAAVVVREAFVATPRPADELDSLATWVDADGATKVIATGKSSHRLVIFDGDTGAHAGESGGRGRGPGQFERPNGIAVFGDLVLVTERDAPRVQVLRRAEMPVHAEPGVVARVYSGQLGSALASTLNAVPVTLADIELTPGASFAPQLAASDNGFIVVIDGDIEAGTSKERLEANMVGWTDPSEGGESLLALRAGERGARLLLYAGQQQNISVSARGPFIAGSPEELSGYYADYRRGKFPHAGSLRPPGRA